MQGELPEGSDTSVDAVVGIYGRYDWEDRSTVERVRFVDFLERVVVKRRLVAHPEIFRKASPIARVHRRRAAVPGHPRQRRQRDPGRSRHAASSSRLRAVSRSVVSYVELPGAGHGFDMIDGARTGSMATAIGLFLNQIHRNRMSARPKRLYRRLRQGGIR